MIIPDKVTRLETYVFNNSHNITNIYIPGANATGAGVNYIGE